MSLGQPHVKRALEWILERLSEEPHASRSELIDQAAREFDLTPLESEFLYRQLVETTRGRPPGAPPA